MPIIPFIKEYFPGFAKKNATLLMLASAVVITFGGTSWGLNLYAIAPRENQIKDLEKENTRLEGQLLPVRTAAMVKYSEFTEDEAIGKLLTRMGQVELGVISLLDYQEVSTWDASGIIHKGIPGSVSMTGDSPIAGWNQDYWQIENGDLKTIRCDTDAIAQYQKVAKQYPLYPFSFYSLAMCQQKEENEEWKVNIQRAFEILSRTTVVPNHHQEHDWLMNKITVLKKD